MMVSEVKEKILNIKNYNDLDDLAKIMYQDRDNGITKKQEAYETICLILLDMLNKKWETGENGK